MKFLDSNILIYAADETDRSKFDTACDDIMQNVGVKCGKDVVESCGNGWEKGRETA